MTSRFFLRELYWIVGLIAASYVIIAINTSFSLSEPIRPCTKSLELISKPTVIILLTMVFCLTRVFYHYVLKIENQSIRYFMLPVTLIALPASLILVWFQFMGC